MADIFARVARMFKRQNPVSNVDENNLVILEAELKNLQLLQHQDVDTQVRIEYLKRKIAELKEKGTPGGNPNTQRRPKESRWWRN
jgi:hypothetical protein